MIVELGETVASFLLRLGWIDSQKISMASHEMVNVFHTGTPGSTQNRELVWQTLNQEAVLLRRLKWDEATWLVQEIKSWLAKPSD